MRRIREVLRLRAELGPNLSAISAGAKLARSTVRAYLDRATAAGLDAVGADGLSETALEAALYPPSSTAKGRMLPDWASEHASEGEVDQELRRHKHVTRKLLWMEYKAADPDGLGFSQFKLRLSEWQKASGRGLSMRQVHHAGETVQVDYAGDTVAVMDNGTARAAQVFVACLPCSGLIYAEASWTQATEDWLGARCQRRLSPPAGWRIHRPQVAVSTGLGWRLPPARARYCRRSRSGDPRQNVGARFRRSHSAIHSEGAG
jgi:transposase